MDTPKNINDQMQASLAAFCKDPDSSKLQSLLQGCLGEFNHLDFKQDFPEPAKLAKHLLAIANTRGGCLVIGVADAKAHGGVAKPIGIETPVDPTELGKKLREYLPETLADAYKLLTFTGSAIAGSECEGRFFQVIALQPDERYLPFIARKATTGIDADAVYVRRNAESVLAKTTDYADMMHRLNAATSGAKRPSNKTIAVHLSELDSLYGEIAPTVKVRKPKPEGTPESELVVGLRLFGNLLYGETESKPNPHFPSESKDEFIARAIVAKKRRIEGILDL